MQTIIIVIHLLIVIALVGTVLMQRSEGGGLGIGGGSGFMSARGAANALTRTTAILAAAFFATSLALSLFARYQGQPGDIFDNLPEMQQEEGESGSGGILDDIGGSVNPTAPAPAETEGGAPSSEVPPSPAEEEAAPAEDTAPAEPESQVPTGD